MVHEQSKDDTSEKIVTTTREAHVVSALCFPRKQTFYGNDGHIDGARSPHITPAVLHSRLQVHNMCSCHSMLQLNSASTPHVATHGPPSMHLTHASKLRTGMACRGC